MTEDCSFETESGRVEILGFNLFQYAKCPEGRDRPRLRLGRFMLPVGIVHLKVTKGLSSHIFSTCYYKYGQKADGSPDIEKINPFSKVRLSMAARVAEAVQVLIDVGYFPEQAEIEIESDQYGEERLILKNWDSEYTDYLLEEVFREIVLETERIGRAMSLSWYCAKAAQLYFNDDVCVDANDAFNIGFFLAEMNWKFSFEHMAYEGINARISRESATQARQIKAPITARNKLQIIAILYNEVCDQDSANKKNDSAAARAIYELAYKRKPKELMIKKDSAIIGVDAISKHLRALQKEGTI